MLTTQPDCLIATTGKQNQQIILRPVMNETLEKKLLFAGTTVCWGIPLLLNQLFGLAIFKDSLSKSLSNLTLFGIITCVSVIVGFFIIAMLVLLYLNVHIYIYRKKPKARQVKPEDRKYLTKTVPDIISPYKTLTELEANLITRDYLGMWIKVEVLFRNVSENHDHSTLQLATSDANSGIRIFLDFDIEEHKSEVRSLDKNKTYFVVQGEIRYIMNDSIFIEDCEFVEIDSRPPKE